MDNQLITDIHNNQYNFSIYFPKSNQIYLLKDKQAENNKENQEIFFDENLEHNIVDNSRPVRVSRVPEEKEGDPKSRVDYNQFLDDCIFTQNITNNYEMYND